MWILYLWLWVGFVVGSLVLGVLLAVGALRLLVGWRPKPTSARVAGGCAGASLFGFVYGALMWLGMSDSDAGLRAQTAAPPLCFGVLAMVAAAGLAMAGGWARRSGGSRERSRRQTTGTHAERNDS
jgi:hypothetical protein